MARVQATATRWFQVPLDWVLILWWLRVLEDLVPWVPLKIGVLSIFTHELHPRHRFEYWLMSVRTLLWLMVARAALAAIIGFTEEYTVSCWVKHCICWWLRECEADKPSSFSRCHQHLIFWLSEEPKTYLLVSPLCVAQSFSMKPSKSHAWCCWCSCSWSVCLLVACRSFEDLTKSVIKLSGC